MRRDGMGPDNQGPRTGRGLGNCSPAENNETRGEFGFQISDRRFGTQRRGFGSGRGMGRGMRRGLGRGIFSRRGMDLGGRL